MGTALSQNCSRFWKSSGKNKVHAYMELMVPQGIQIIKKASMSRISSFLSGSRAGAVWGCQREPQRPRTRGRVVVDKVRESRKDRDYWRLLRGVCFDSKRDKKFSEGFNQRRDLISHSGFAGSLPAASRG